MTDRKPDIITQWKIKDNQDGTYTARCPAMPNVELTAENIVSILSKIERCLKSMYPDNSQVDGGITGINAEYSVTKRMEQSLDCFTIPTDDPTPEPATDAPELHEDTVDTIDTNDTGKKEKKQRVKHNCESCVLYSSFGNCANAESPLYNQFVKEPYKVCKHHKKTLDGNYVHNKIVTKDQAKSCGTCRSLSDHNQCLCPDSPNYRDMMNPDYFNACEKHETEQEYNDRALSTPYKWKPIKALEAGCAQCEKKQKSECPGNKAGYACNDYHARGDAGNECRTCKRLGGKMPHQQGGVDMYYCNEHKATVSLDDYCCYAYKGANE